MKRPAFQFYPADWRSDPALATCSLAAKGLWIEIMCIIHETEEYGFLALNGCAITNAQLSRMLGETPALVAKLIAELERAGVFNRDDRGVIYSRRMARDENMRNYRASCGYAGKEYGNLGAEHGAKGGRPKNTRGDIDDQNNPPHDKLRGVLKPPLPHEKTPLTTQKKPPPSSSSSSSYTPTPNNASSVRGGGGGGEIGFPETETLEDNYPTHTTSRIIETKRRINSMHPSWRRTYTSIEDMTLQANLRFFLEITDDEWRLLSAYMDAVIPAAWGREFFQPNTRGKFLEAIANVLTAAESWARRCRRESIEWAPSPRLFPPADQAQPAPIDRQGGTIEHVGHDAKPAGHNGHHHPSQPTP